MSTTVRTVIFDFDGTVADTLPLIYGAFNAAITPALGRSLTEREIREHFGPTDHDIIRSILDEQFQDEAIATYVDFYEREHDRLAGVFVDMDRLLRRCREKGIMVGIVTGKSRVTADISLKAIGLDDDYDILVAGDDISRPKPDPEGILTALAALDHPGGSAGAYVGDTAADVFAGRAAGLKTIGVTWGSPDHQELVTAHPDVICSTVLELAAALGVELD